ncbi:MAG: hypothetical protein QG656_603, partial [Candidatus Hydrogenedentes bacterium]|nr:hypothetical protein [Candidatus Hydrogenedentota bacterium]
GLGGSGVMEKRLTAGLLIEKLRGRGLVAIMARGASGTFVVNVLGAGIAFGSQVALARLMSPSHYGAYILVISWITVLQFVAVLGLDKTMLRFLAVYRTRTQWDLFRGLLRGGYALTLLASLAVGGVVALAAWLLRAHMDAETMATFLWGAAVLPFLALSILRQASLQSLRHVVVAQMPELLVRPVLVAGMVFLVYRYVGQAVPGHTAMMLNFVGTQITYLMGGLLLSYYLPAESAGRTRTYHTREWMAMAWPLMLVAGMHILTKKTDILMLGMFAGKTAAGIYGPATRLTDLITFGILAVMSIASPLIAEAHARQKPGELQRILFLASWGIVAFCVPIVAGIVVFGKFLLGIFGPEYVAGYGPLTVLMAGQVVNALTGPCVAALTMTGHQNVTAKILGCVVVVNIVLNAVLIPRFGLMGAAAATSISIALNKTFEMVYVWRLLRVNPTIFMSYRKVLS